MAVRRAKLHQLDDQAALFGLRKGPRVMSDQLVEGRVSAVDVAKIASTVEGVKPAFDEGRRIADVVQPGCRLDDLRRFRVEDAAQGSCLLPNRLRMSPTSGQGVSEQLFCQALCPLHVLIHASEPKDVLVTCPMQNLDV